MNDVNVTPIELGSGSADPGIGDGGPGGGLARLRVTGNLTANGTISANGATETLGGGGGGGRIAIYRPIGRWSGSLLVNDAHIGWVCAGVAH